MPTIFKKPIRDGELENDLDADDKQIIDIHELGIGDGEPTHAIHVDPNGNPTGEARGLAFGGDSVIHRDGVGSIRANGTFRAKSLQVEAYNLGNSTGVITPVLANGSVQYTIPTGNLIIAPITGGAEGNSFFLVLQPAGLAYDLDFPDINKKTAVEAVLPVTLEAGNGYIIEMRFTAGAWTFQDIDGPYPE